jgi:Fur family peroxide stress response transcriptional regulator
MQKEIEQFIQNCKQIGLHVTYQRIAIYQRLLNRVDHPTADDLYQEMVQEFPTLSRATVYKTLETLSEHNLISKVTQLHDIARYDGQQNHHHHLVCIKCKKIMDINNKHLDNLGLPDDLDTTFKIVNYRIQFDGICHACQSKL